MYTRQFDKTRNVLWNNTTYFEGKVFQLHLGIILTENIDEQRLKLNYSARRNRREKLK